MDRYDAVIVGSGPNGLAAAITLARAGRSVIVFEGEGSIGGGMRSAELTLPGFVHDICSAVHPLARSSPFFRSLPLEAHGLEWVDPPLPLAHPLDGAEAIALHRSVEATSAALGPDAGRYRRLIDPCVRAWPDLAEDVLAPLQLPKHPLTLMRFGLPSLLPARFLAEWAFAGIRGRALFAGLAAHSLLPLERLLTAAFGLLLAIVGHAVGWPVAKGGSQRIADALASYLQSQGGRIVTGTRIERLDELPPSRAILLDVTPRQLIALAGDRLPAGYRERLARYRYGVGVFKIDWALAGPIPWTASECRLAGTVHVGGSLDEISESEAAPWNGKMSARPFVLLAQPSLFDSTRAPAGKQSAWAYCHVPHGWSGDATELIERQVERFAPGFRDLILARSIKTPADLERQNPNLIGGDIGGGVQDIWQAFARPTLAAYSTPVPGLYLCSASTPPGGGVHGMCGWHAARVALRYLDKKRTAR